MDTTEHKVSLNTLDLDSFNPSIMQETVRGSDIEHIQLAHGRFQAHLLSTQLGEERLDYGSYNLPLHALGSMPETHVTLGAVLKSNGFATLNGSKIRRPAMVVVNEGKELDYIMAPASEWLAFQVKRETLELPGMDLPGWLNGVVDIEQQDLQPILTCLQDSISMLHEINVNNPAIAAPDKFHEKIFAGIHDAFSDALQSTGPDSYGLPNYPGKSLKIIKQVIDYFHVYYREPLGIGTMCAELGVNQKSVIRAFLKHYGITPKRYLDYFRLAKARRLITRQSGCLHSITEVAHQCGINHLGRFAALYRDTYGELPSQTQAD